jgi:hypothetical protein
MYVKGSTTEVVRTGSAEFVTVDGVMFARASLNNSSAAVANASAPATNQTAPTSIAAENPQAVMRTASYLGYPYTFDSRAPIHSLMEMKYIYVQGDGEVCSFACASHTPGNGRRSFFLSFFLSFMCLTRTCTLLAPCPCSAVRIALMRAGSCRPA